MVTQLRTESGISLHPIGIGTYPIGSRQNPATRDIYPDRSNDEQNIAAITYSLSRGQNHIDTAELYGRGHTEELVGAALRQSGIVRENIFVASKLWKEHVAPQNVRPAVESMLGRLGINAIDLLYVHTTKYRTPWVAGLPAMGRLVDEGLVRHIGVSEFNLNQLHQAETISDHPIAALQLEYNIGHPREITPALREHCQERRITLVAYSPLGTGETLNRPDVWTVARRHRATPAQIALAWCMRNETLPIPKTTNPRHIDQNLESVNLTLTDRDMQQLGS